MTPSLLSQLQFLEIGSPDPAASVSFYRDKFGLTVVDEIDGSTYLRSWGDYQRFSLVISPADETSLIRMVFRAASAEALEEAAARVEGAGQTGQWSEGGVGHGRAYDFVGPYGHRMTIVWEVDFYEAPAEEKSWNIDRPQKRSLHAGAPRFLDHVTVGASDVRGMATWYADTLGFRIMAFTDLDEAPVTVFSVITTNEKSHDIGIVADFSDRAGRVNHFAFWLDTREELLIAADILMEQGIPIEYGPGIHGIGEQSFLYFREPSGLRVELNTGGYRNYVADWEPKVWSPAVGSANIYRNGVFPESMTESFPAADNGTALEQGISEEMRDALLHTYEKQGRG